LDIDEIERRAREQLSFHPDRSDANCQRCAAQEELLALVAEIRRLRGSSQAGSAPACPKCRVVGGGWDERTGTCASCGFIRVELKVSRERLREQIAADPDDVSVEAGAGSAGSPACAWCQGLLARATADGEEPSQEAMEHFELAGHFAGCPYLRVPEPFISKEGLGGNRQECTPRHDAPGFSEVNLARCVSPDGFGHALDSWSIAEWTNAAAGEMGEACNLAKKLLRHRDGVAGNKKPEDQNVESLRQRCAEELADVVIYADLAMRALGRDLNDTVRAVFNRKSDELGAPYRVTEGPLGAASPSSGEPTPPTDGD